MSDLVSFKSLSLLTDFTVRIDADIIIRQASAPSQEFLELAYLKKLPLSVLKIDKSFVDDVPQGTEDVAIVLAISGLAAGLELPAVAEEVETAEQLEFLKSKGCDLAQGYLTGRPMDDAAFQEKLIA